MKPALFLPPVLSLLVITGWIGNGRMTLATLEKESTALRKRLAARSSANGSTATASKPEAPGKVAKDKEPIDWKKLAGQLVEMEKSGGMTDIRAMIRLQQRIQAMSRDEIVAALDEIAVLDLPDESRAMLEQTLIGPLCQKDPEFALTRYIDRMNEARGTMSWQLSNAMKEWTVKDPASALSWFDRQIAAGKFDSKSLDGRSQSRMQFEGVVIGTLLSTNPSGAASRLKALPEDQRAEVLQNYAGNAVKEDDQLAFANLARGQLSEEEQGKAIGQQASRLAWNDGYTKITEYLDRIEATPAERAACVLESTDSKISRLAHKGKVTPEDIESLREWATRQSPGSANKATGKALAQSAQTNNGMEFSTAADLAVRYHDTAGNDDVLAEFLDGGAAYGHKEQARELADKISDPELREKFISRFK